MPSVSILAEPPLALVDANVDAKGAREVAQSDLEHLHSEEGQRIAARRYCRPSDPSLADPADAARFGEAQLVRVEDVFGSWASVQKTHFADGGVFDRIYTAQ